ncbi:MAG: tetratricopeptide repeat protein, partial [Deltaproteobacteria bacterium]
DVELDVDESASAPPDATSDAADDSDASEPDEVSVPAAAPTEAHEPQPAEAQRSAQTSGGRARSAATRQKIAEDLEEAEFYFNQEFYDEARKIYERVLSMDPNQPQAMLRMGEIAKVCGEPPDPKPAARPAPEPAAAAPVEHPEASADDTEEASADEAEEASADDPDVAMQDATDEPTLDDADEDLDLDIDVDDEDLEPDDSTESEISAPTGAVLRGADPAKLREAAVEQTEPIAEAAGETAESDADEPEEDHGEFQAMVDELSDESDADAPAEEEAVAEDGFDLARELQGALANDEPSTGSEAAETAEEGFESIFRDFKQGVDRTLGEGDLDTHYDLGIAYREMGLIDDAIAEFRLTLGLPERRLDSLHMLGLCALEVGRPPDAIAHFEQALAEPALPDAQRTALRFDLGRAHEENGDTARARSMYEL